MPSALDIGFGQGSPTLIASRGLFSAPAPSASLIQVAGPGPQPGNSYKYNPGNYGVAEQYGSLQGASTSNDLIQIKKLVNNPAQGFVTQCQWSDLDSGSSLDNNPADAVAGTGNFAGFTSRIGASFNLLQTYCPGANFGLYVNCIQIWLSKPPTGPFSCSVPNYILNCGGSLYVPSNFGAGSGTNYTLYEYNIGTCGHLFYAWNSPQAGDYGFVTANYADPAVVNAFNNFSQALALYQLPTAQPYNANTVYALGALVTSNGAVYCSIQGSNVNNPVSSTSYWMLSSNKYAGQTLNQCEKFELLANSDETSCVFNQGPLVAGQTTNNQVTYQNYYRGYFSMLTARSAAFPNTALLPSFSFSIQGTDGVNQDARTWTQYMAQASRITGLGFSAADMRQDEFTPGKADPTDASCGYIGVDPDSKTRGTDVWGSYSTNFVGAMPAFPQIEALDYGPSNQRNAAAVQALMRSCDAIQATHVLWSMQDEGFSQTSWASYIQPTFAAGKQPWGTSTNNPGYRPSLLP